MNNSQANRHIYRHGKDGLAFEEYRLLGRDAVWQL
jgi:hypothetical protein